ncbi:hypothetical protein EVAR_58058_1 [Eumeta japonica]|uniref:Uncharacterized protein n=1 Tax=Eumeta variegata TaxID=151549 RepID=A0A4C1SMQ6_EUMVA|nr:hypothetical protein EVAR_58058_1 [Eumeta japonica]
MQLSDFHNQRIRRLAPIQRLDTDNSIFHSWRCEVRGRTPSLLRHYVSSPPARRPGPRPMTSTAHRGTHHPIINSWAGGAMVLVFDFHASET